MTKIYYKANKDDQLKILETFKPDAWIHIEKAERNDIKEISTKFELDEGIIFDALDIDEVPRIEKEDGVLYLFARFVVKGDQFIDTAPILLILKKETLISISPAEFPRIEQFTAGKVTFTTTEPIKLMLKILLQIDQTYNEYLTETSKRIRLSSGRIDRIKNRDIIQFVELENTLNDVNNSLVRMNATFTHLLSGKFIKFSESELDLMEDLSLNSAQQIQITKENLQSIVNIRNAYSTIMTNNLNRIIKLFTSLTVILTIPTIIGTFFGMNMALPFQDRHEAFAGVVVISVVLCVVSILLFMYKDWM